MAADANRAKEIFLAAIEQSGPERERFVQNAAGNNADLIARVTALLKAHDDPVSFLDEAMLGTNIVSPNELEEAETAGTTIGPYKLLEKIGEGGFGVVYMADQQAPVRRRVALKIIKPGMDTKQVIARFEAERQALALMDHPHIARVLDAGTTTAGKPYFVMELVRGIPITEYCDQNNLSVRERLELFVPVCHAVQHAHQKGIIHRDLKPSNVLVTLHDGKPVPKVIDFGVAKAMSQQLTDKTLFTQFAQMVGTPLYMSPEQAEMSGLDVDTRSDIYSLGVLLYELLTGTTPFDKHRLRKVAMDEMRRIIREEEPPRPSTRISTLGETRTSIAAHRKSDPDRLGQLVRGDLDWIVMKAIEKDRTHRYETANGFARDVQRFLADQPIEARPPTATYRFRKFARRNRLALITASLVSGALVVGVVISTWQAIRATRAERAAATALQSEAEQRKVAEAARDAEAVERRNAEEQRAEAERQRKVAETEAATAKQISDFLVGLFEPEGGNTFFWQLGAVENKGSTLTAREILDRGAQRSLRDLESQPDVQTRLMDTIGYIYRNLGQLNDAEPLLAEALQRRRAALGVDHADVAQSYEHIAWLRYDQGNGLEAIRLHREALAVRRKQFGENHLAVADSLASLGFLTTQDGNKAEAEQWFREALAIREKLLPPGHPDIGVCLWGIGFALSRQAVQRAGDEQTQRLDDARSLNAKARDIFSKIDGGENMGLVACGFLDSQLDASAGNLPQAAIEAVETIAFAKRLVSENHPLIAILMREHINLLELMGKPKEAAEVRTELLKVVEATYGPDHPLVGEVLATVGRYYSNSDATTEEIEAILELLQQRQKLEQQKWESSKDDEQAWIELRPDKLAGLHSEIGKLLLRTNRIPEGEEQFRDALSLRKLVAQKRNTTIAIASFHDYRLLAQAKLAGGDHSGALAGFHQADEIVDQRLEADPEDRKYAGPDVANGWDVLHMLASQARALFAEQQLDDGLALLEGEVQRRRELASRRPTSGQHRVKLGHALWILGDLYTEIGKPGEPERIYLEALQITQQLATEFPDQSYFRQEVGFANMKLGWEMRSLGRFDEAKQRFRAAIEAYGTASPEFPEYIEMRRRCREAAREFSSIALDQKRHAEVSELVELVSRQSANDWNALSELAEMLSHCAAVVAEDASLSEQEREATAARYHRRAAELDDQETALSPDALALNNEAWHLVMNRTDPQRAVRLSKKSNKLQPDNAMFLNTLGVAYYRAGDWRSAEAELLRSCELPGAWTFFGLNAHFLAMTRSQLGDQEAARQWFRSAVQWNRLNAPNNRENRDIELEAATLLGQPDVSDLPQGEPIDNIAITEPLLKLPLNLPWVHDVRAGTFIDRNDWKLAAFEARQMVTPESSFAQFYPVALIELTAHNMNEYRETCSKLLALAEATDSANLHIISWACVLNSESVSDWRPVAAVAQRAVDDNPQDVAPHLTLGAVKYRVGEFDAAINCIQTAEKLFVDEEASLRMSPAYGWYFLAMVHQKQGNSTEAGKWLSKANAETDRVLAESIPWNRRATLNLLREEAQTVVGETSE